MKKAPLMCFALAGMFVAFSTVVDAEWAKRSEEASAFYNLSLETKAKIEEALPVRASADAEATRQLLVFNLHVRDGKVQSGHPSIPTFNYALMRMGEVTGAYRTWFSSDPRVLGADSLSRFDAIVFNNTAGVLTEDETLRRDFLDYIYAGGGFVGTHAAGATFCQWPRYDYFPEYGEMLGGFESGGHPWKPNEWINLKIDEPSHPVAAAFGGNNFDVSDEVFQFTDPYSRNRLRVLLSIDTKRTDMSEDRRILPERRADEDLAISWVKSYGKGKVFYTSLGHNEHLAWNPKTLKHYLDGIQFALGDLAGPTTPSAKLNPALRAQESLGWRFGIEAYTFKDNTLLETIENVDSLGLAYIGGLNVQQVSEDIPKKFDYELSRSEIAQVRSALNKRGLRMLTYFIFDIPGDEATCRRIFEFGKQMGIEAFISEPKPENLDVIERFCEEYQIKLAIHNHGARLSENYRFPEGIMKVCEGRSPLIGAACDFGYWAREGINPLDALKVLGERVITLQVHDQSALDDEGHDVPWGTGVVPFAEILSYLHVNRIKPVMFGLEYSRNWGQSGPELKASIQYFNSLTQRLSNH